MSSVDTQKEDDTESKATQEEEEDVDIEERINRAVSEKIGKINSEVEEKLHIFSQKLEALEEENRDLLASYRKDEIQAQPEEAPAEGTREIDIINSSTDEVVEVALVGDTYSMMMLSKVSSTPWVFGFGVFALQFILLCMILVGQILLSQKQNYFGAPVNVTNFVRVGQCLAILILFTLQDDVIIAVRMLSIFAMSKESAENLDSIHVTASLREGSFEQLDSTSTSNSGNYWKTFCRRILFPNLCKFTQGTLALATSFIIVISSEDLIDLFKDFAALSIISLIDDVTFKICKNGFFGIDLQKKAEDVSEFKLKQKRKVGLQLPIQTAIVLILVIVLYILWGVFLRGQVSRTFFKKEYPKCPVTEHAMIDRVGDGKCDSFANSIECGFDAGDCINFNLAFPLCDADEPERIGDGVCDKKYVTKSCMWDNGDCCEHLFDSMSTLFDKDLLLNDVCDGGMYNTEECMWDNGSCVVENYPECHVDNPNRLGDKICDGFPYISPECGWDFGDCCEVEDESKLGDGNCDADKVGYDSPQCLYDGGDCARQQWIPGCRIIDESKIHNGVCDPEYNKEECHWDGFDCLVRVKTTGKIDTGYGKCHVDKPELIDNGICDPIGAYNTFDCRWDGGDCIKKDKNFNYTNCHVDINKIGNGSCDEENNTPECNYDGLDCEEPTPTLSPTFSPTVQGFLDTIVINNGFIMLGINKEGMLHVPAGEPDAHSGETTVGLRFFRGYGWYESTSFGCQCEGYGVSYSHISDGKEFWGGAHKIKGVANIVAESLRSNDGKSAISKAKIAEDLRITHNFRPSSETDYLYHVKITIENLHDTETVTNIRYRRVMDFDIPPSIYTECVSISFSEIPASLEYTTDDGFEGINPLEDVSESGIEFSCPYGIGCPVLDSGRSDHGALFQFLFRNNDGSLLQLGPREMLSFDMFIGAANTKEEANNALTEVGIEIYALAYPPQSFGCSALNPGLPNIFMLGFRDLGLVTQKDDDFVERTIIDNGVIMLGINKEGMLHVPGEPDAHNGETTVGLRFFRDDGWYESTSFGYQCEGYGVSYSHISDGKEFWGGANADKGISNIVAESLWSDGESAISKVRLGEDLRIIHSFEPANETDNLYRVKITIENLHDTEAVTNIRYRREIDFDIPPKIHSECVSIFYDAEPSSFEYATDDGFENTNPLEDVSASGLYITCLPDGDCPAYDKGPADHGALFQFLFKNSDGSLVQLGPGKKLSFDMYFGAASKRKEANEALEAVSAEIATIAYPPTIFCSKLLPGSPNVFILAFTGVSGNHSIHE